MTLSTIIADKKKYNQLLKKNFWVTSKHKCIGLIKINDKDILDLLITGLPTLPCTFIIETDLDLINNEVSNIFYTSKIKNDLITGFDFILCDDDLDWLSSYMKKWITPIIIKNNHMSSLLSEFDPMKSEGNCYFYEENNSWSIFYSVIRYLENYKFPYDNRNLVKNIIWT